jgi:hypothetical protein
MGRQEKVPGSAFTVQGPWIAAGGLNERCALGALRLRSSPAVFEKENIIHSLKIIKMSSEYKNPVSQMEKGVLVLCYCNL